ncbi:MAG: asparagine synthase (glutamine-hydrolyzing) [Eubacteriales bacterium]
MCGIVGFSSQQREGKKIVRAMTDAIRHRGPDGAGYFLGDRTALGFCQLSHTRESVCEQPLYNEGRTLVLVCDGLIYNDTELRAALIGAGHNFRTRNHAEVIVHGYEEWGEEVVLRLRGMYAFVLWDKVHRVFFGARDSFGIKPLYYIAQGGFFAFASEIKGLLRHPDCPRGLNHNALRAYLSLEYSGGNETFFRGVMKVPPGYSFIYKDEVMFLRRRYLPQFREGQAAGLYQIESALRDAVAHCRHSGGKVGAFLSGGVDSSLVTALANPDITFSVGFAENGFDERADAARLSEIFSIEHQAMTVTAGDCFAALPDILYHMDEPQANPSVLPLWFLSDLAGRQVRTVLSGEGADELFGGYETYGDSTLMQTYRRLPQLVRTGVSGAVRRLPYFKGRDFLVRGGGRPEQHFIGQAHVFSAREATELLTPAFRSGPTALQIAARYYSQAPELDELTKKQYLDLQLWMPGDVLLKADRMSMAHSLEVRVPYLDTEVAQAAMALPTSMRLSPTESKPALRAVARRLLPAEYANRPKKGFPVPIRLWLREAPYAQLLRETFLESYTSQFFNRHALLAMLEEHQKGRKNYGRKLWTVYVFLVWYRLYFLESSLL